MKKIIVMIVALCIMPAKAIFANDSAFGGEGSDLIPLKETRIRMVSEDIRMTFQHDKWHVKAVYIFKNPTRENIMLQMGFPEILCDNDEGDCNGYGFKNLVTKVRGQIVEQQKGKVDSSYDWVPRLGNVYLYTVSFKPLETVKIHHTYRHGANTTAWGESWIQYVTRTGSLWNGPISKARFTVRTPHRPWNISFPTSFTLKSYVEYPQNIPGKGITEWVFEMNNWMPKENFIFKMATYPTDYLDSTFTPSSNSIKACPLATNHPSVFSEFCLSREQKLKSTLPKLSKEQLRICRNLLYAFHGYSFKNAKLQKFFYDDNIINSTDPEYHKKQRTFIGLHPNPHFSSRLLSPFEQFAIKMIRREERHRIKATR